GGKGDATLFGRGKGDATLFNWLYQKAEYRVRNQNSNTAFGTPTGSLAYDGYDRLTESMG
ncbi:MAG TPA: hypothetical protein VF501_01420, partial [Thiobacillus sp.]